MVELPIPRCVLVLFMALVGAPQLNAQPLSSVMEDLSRSHIDANVPADADFDLILTRDLTAYFCKGQKGCSVRYDLLRRGATQSGVAYPKYYLWVRSTVAGHVMAEGAVRVAAMDKVRFDVTTFLATSEIAATPERVSAVFPAALVDEIERRARVH